ncbi:ATP-binding protein [Vibrio sp. B1FLJ16]|uniref:ATP-binding protein n=1 Tax=Vibrio sp. B1FLJ16 TaxID=2751178 RepID=UPI0015F67A19|nr:transporter substrate-binding domain-containing protein [Vibrio sp. B1FLJ16]CAD7819963.1 PhoQ Sensor [Vibrio sp. B1FLJ16]CAE6941281.1 PhoQ Sensor [Vibrio sp. B1FLJ16]
MFSILRKAFLLTVTFISVLVSFHASAVSANEEQRDTVTVGVITQRESADSIVDSIGPFYGINLDYLSNIAKVLNLRVKLRPYNEILPLLADVESGVIDGAVGFSKTPDREARFLFSQPFFSSTIAVWYEDTKQKERDQRRIKWVCVKGTAYCESLKKQGFTNIVPVKSNLEAFEYVRSGRANALISTYVAITQYLDEQNIVKGAIDVPDWLPDEKVSFITGLGNQELVNQINKILNWEKSGKNIRSVASSNPYHINDKLLVEYRRKVGNDRKITYSSSEDSYPFLYKNEQSGHLDGFLPDFMELIQSRTGLKFDFVKPNASLSSGLTAFNSDLVPVAYVDEVPASDWLVTKPFMHNKFVSIRTKEHEVDATNRSKLGLLISFKKQGLVHLNSWQHDRFTRYDDVRQLLSDLKSGKLDIAYVPDDVIHSLIAQDQVDGLTVNHHDTLKLSIAFAVSNHDTQLKNMLDSVIETIDSNEIDKLLRSYQNFNLVYGYDDEHMARVFLLAALAFALLLVVVYFVLSHLKLKVNLAELNANNEEKEKKWLMDIIQEINSLVFIHDENNSLEMSNCARYQHGQCKECSLKNCSTNSRLVENKSELIKVFEGKRIAEEVASSGCGLGINHVYRERKTISSPSGKKKLVLTLIQDITTQKEREQALIDAQEKAQTAVRARENFLATMSHELRTPLAAAHSILDLLERQVDDASNRELITQAMRSLNHLNVLVDEVLDYSKLEAGQLTVVPVKTDLIVTLCDVLRSFEPKALDKGLDYKVVIKPFAERLVEVDSLRLNQIVTNLLSNAIKFTAEGEIGISVTVYKAMLTVKVADTGIGMTESQLAGVLDPFVQADDTITRKFGGTGLGLSIVDRLIQCMGGELSIDSQYGLGTTIVVKLPVTECDYASENYSKWTYSEELPLNVRQWCDVWDVQPALDEANLVPEFDLEGRCKGIMFSQQDAAPVCLSCNEIQYPDMLLTLFDQSLQEPNKVERVSESLSWIDGTVVAAEDNLINQSIITMQLNELGIKPVIVNNGCEAWEYIQRNENVAVLLTDFHMPEMDGYELVKHVKSSQKHKAIPVIGVTAEDSRLASEKAKEMGMDDVLYKPYDLNKLKRVLIPFIGQTEQVSSPTWIEKFPPREAKEIAQVFSQSMATDIEKLNSASTEKDKKQVIHGIKGAVGAIGISMLVELCIRAEKASAAELDKYVAELTTCIEKEIEKIENWAEINEQTV